MRIISGKYKGKRLFAPKNLPVRPTTDMQKEALFNILTNQYYIQDIHVLDLFSGTGNIAYEFASRGCTQIIAVDQHYACIKYISQTAKELDFSVKTIKSDVFKFLKSTDNVFDVIFADPPYNIAQDLFEKIPNLIFKKNLIKEAGILIIEHATQTDLSHLSHFKEARKYGSSTFSFFE
jgi:16S rRNA (guanine(966)-N(2))-methyltransferase RsmD